MITIAEPRGTTVIRLMGVPQFPDRLMPMYEAASLGGAVNEVEVFLTAWQTICSHKGIVRARATGEDRIQAKRLLARHTPDQLAVLADIFLGSELAEPLRGRYFHHLRLFAHHMPQLIKMRETTHYG
jgi:hypothetical protein